MNLPAPIKPTCQLANRGSSTSRETSAPTAARCANGGNASLVQGGRSIGGTAGRASRVKCNSAAWACFDLDAATKAGGVVYEKRVSGSGGGGDGGGGAEHHQAGDARCGRAAGGRQVGRTRLRGTA